VASLVLWKLLLREPPPLGSRSGRPRWPLRLAKGVATLAGAAAAGAGSLLVVTTIVNDGGPTMTRPTMLGVWAVGSVLAMLFIGRTPLLIRRVVTRTCLALGLQGVILPLATLVSFAVAGTRLAGPAELGGDRLLEVLGIRLVGNLPAVWMGLGGFCVGLILVIVGDRARSRVAGRRARPGFRSRAGVISARARHRRLTGARTPPAPRPAATDRRAGPPR
jgi:hypothetical protein